MTMDTLSPLERSHRMSLIRGRDTGPELVVRKLVHAMGFRYRKHDARLPGKPDLVFAGRRKVIFVHGCFWHRHACPLGRMPKSRLAFWIEKLEGNRRRDQRNLRLLRKAGWTPLVVWECQTSSLPRLSKRIRTFLT